MIPIIIAIIIAAIGLIVFPIVKDKASYSDFFIYFTMICAFSPMLALVFLLLFVDFVELGEYKVIKENNLTIHQSIIEMKIDNEYSEEIIEKAEKHNVQCENYYDTFQKNIKWSVLGKFRKSALDYKVDIPKTSEIPNSNE